MAKRKTDGEREQREAEQQASQQERSQRHGLHASPAPELLSEHAADVGMRVDQHMRQRYQQDKVMANWADRGDGYPERPGSEQRARQPYQNTPREPGSQLAMGHSPSDPRVPGAPGQSLSFQPNLHPEHGADIAAVGMTPGPLQRSVELHQQLVMVNHAAASAPFLHEQIGLRSPMGAAGAARRMPEGTASNQPGQPAGAAPREVPARPPGFALDATTMPVGDRGLSRSTHQPPRVDAPGSEYTSRVPGEHR